MLAQFCIVQYKIGLPLSENVLHNTNMTSHLPTKQTYGEIQQAYDFYNQALFDGQLPPCLFTLQREKRTMGYFSSKRFVRRKPTAAQQQAQPPAGAAEFALPLASTTDEIALNPEYFAAVPLMEVLQTLVHEMVHLWQAHFGTPSRACYHNREWANKMERLGLMPTDTGQPGGRKTGQTVMDYVIAGGAFEQASTRLLATQFAITWLDRYPVRPNYPALLPSAPMISAALSQGTWLELAAGQEDDDDMPLAERDRLTTLLAAAYTPPSHTQPDDVEERQTGDRSNRDKYTCLSCHNVNVWGRPNLRIKCADCNVMLVVVAG